MIAERLAVCGTGLRPLHRRPARALRRRRGRHRWVTHAHFVCVRAAQLAVTVCVNVT